MTSTIQNQLNFDHLPIYQKRQFVPEKADLTNGEQLTSLYNTLLERTFSSVKDLERWALDRSELESALDQQGTILYIRMTCQTDDEKRAESYKRFIETIVPLVKPLEDRLNQQYLEVLQKYVAAYAKESYALRLNHSNRPFLR